jgi:hypothetical protein
MGRPDRLQDKPPIPGWLAAIVVTGAVLMIAGALLAVVRPALLLGPQDAVTSGVRIYAGYLFSRNLALGILLMAAVWRRAWAELRGLMILYTSVQFLDALVDTVEHRWPIIPVVLILGTLLLVGAARMPQSER